MAGAFHHIELYVSDLKRSRAFWSWLLAELGWALYQEWDAGFSYRKADAYLVFVQVADAYRDPLYHRKRIGLNHIALHAASCRQVDALTEALRERGTGILYEDRHPFAGGPDHYAVFCEDPDRIKVEIVAPDIERPRGADRDFAGF